MPRETQLFRSGRRLNQHPCILSSTPVDPLKDSQNLLEGRAHGLKRALRDASRG